MSGSIVVTAFIELFIAIMALAVIKLPEKSSKEFSDF
jgi:hypothetical protein